jgi:hypothetical protein
MPRILDTLTGPNKSRREIEELEAMGATTCIEEELETIGVAGTASEDEESSLTEEEELETIGDSSAVCDDEETTFKEELETTGVCFTACEDEETTFKEELETTT